MKRLIILGALVVYLLNTHAFAEDHQNSADPLPINVAMQSVGTFSWVIHAMQHFGIDEAFGLQLNPTSYATKQAVTLALQADEADVAVDDFIHVMRLRAQDIPLEAIYPYSLATGGLVVPADSSIESIADLKGKVVGAAGFGDKSLLILRALALSQYDFDPQVDGEVITAAGYLLGKTLADGDADAALPYWHFVARLTSTENYRDVMMVTQMLGEMGLPTDLPILVVVAREGLADEVKQRFVKAIIATTAMMKAAQADFWQSILDKELYSLPNPDQFPDVVARWKSGVPSGWDQSTVDGLVNLARGMLELAGPDVLGIDAVDPETYTLMYLP